MFSSLFVCLSVGNFAQKLPNGFAWNFQGKLAMTEPLNKWLNFGGDTDHHLDTGIVFRIRRYWEIRKLVNWRKSAAYTDSPDGGTGKTCLGGGALSQCFYLMSLFWPTSCCGQLSTTVYVPAIIRLSWDYQQVHESINPRFRRSKSARSCRRRRCAVREKFKSRASLVLRADDRIYLRHNDLSPLRNRLSL